MVFAVESIGQLVLNISLFATGMGFAIVALVLAISRSMTKDNDYWALIFTAFAWCIALVIPNVWFAGIVFGFGAFALTLSFLPIINKIGDSNILILGILALVMNLMLLIGTGAFALSIDWENDYNKAYNDIYYTINSPLSVFENSTPETELCPPNQIDSNNVTCKTDAIAQSSFEQSIFAPLASVFTMGTYANKGSQLFGATALAGLVINNKIKENNYFKNEIITFLIAIYITLWELVIFYKLVIYVTNRWGVK